MLIPTGYINANLPQFAFNEITFAREYNHGETLNLIEIPANARILSIKVAVAPGWVYDENFMTQLNTYIGFSEDHDLYGAFGENTPLLTERPLWHKNASAKNLQMFFYHFSEDPETVATLTVTGQKVRVWVEYIQEAEDV